MTKKAVLFIFLTAIAAGSLVGYFVGDATAGRPRSRPDVYELYQISPDAPLSVTFKRDCIEHPDSVLVIRDWTMGNALIGCIGD